MFIRMRIMFYFWNSKINKLVIMNLVTIYNSEHSYICYKFRNITVESSTWMFKD